MLTIMSWNVLADAYVRGDYYPLTEPDLLAPQRRRDALLARLAAETADVICLQEIEPDTYTLVGERLAAFDGHFVKKVGRPDGCAIFVRHGHAASQVLELTYGDATGHIALAVVVDGVGVATTHVKWEPPDVPCEQRLGRGQLRELLDAWVVDGAPWVVCGDLNADASSAVLEVAFERGFRDAYATLPDACTCNSNGKRKRIDFILHTEHFDATPRPLPPITNDTPLPSASEPSDHLAIAASLSRRPREG